MYIPSTAQRSSHASHESFKLPPDSLQTFITSLPHLLFTKEVPTDVEEAAIRDKIRLVQLDLGQINHDIRTSRRILRQVREKREELTSHLRTLRAFVSPVRRLPYEILSHIYLFAQAIDDSTDDKYDSLNYKRVPLNLVSVSTRWRDVSSSLPQLWNRLTVHFPSNGPRQSSTDSRTLALKTWLDISASHNHPLSINVFARQSYIIQQDGDLLSLLLSSSHCWHTARFECPPDFLSTLSSIKGKIPFLKTLDLRLYTGQLIPQTVNAFAIAPNLSNLEFHFLNSHLGLVLPWHQIKTLTVSRTNEVVEVFRLVTGLEELYIDNSRAPSFWGGLCQLHRLRRIDIKGELSFLNFIEIPCLVEMSLSNTSSASVALIVIGITADPLNHLTSFSIELDFWQCNSSMLSNLLQAIPSITTLRVIDLSERNCGEDINTLLSALTLHRGDSPSVSPRLKSLELSLRHSFKVSLLVDMVESRWSISGSQSRTARLQSLRLLVPPKVVPNDAWRRLDALEQEGLAYSLCIASKR